MILTRAPLRISLGGGGTDLPSYYRQFGGFVLSAAINKYVYINLNRPPVDDLIRVKYSKSETVADIDEIQHSLVREALRLTGVDKGIEISSMADVPAGTGLGSSGSFLVSLLTALYAFKRQHISVHELAETSCHIEMDIVGQPVGKQDQYLAAFGGVTCVDIDRDGTATVSPLKISSHNLAELRNNTLLFYTGVQRRDSAILAQQETETIQGKPQVLESLHTTREIGCQIKAALEQGDLDCFGRLLDKHWQVKKKRSGEISSSDVDRWYAKALHNGALGGKIMGAGGGGFFMLYCPNGRKLDVRQAMAEEGLRELTYDFDFQGAKVLVNLF